MSQFDVHQNIGRNASAIPFVVLVQSAAFDNSKSRIVIPLVRTEKAAGVRPIPSSKINPVFIVANVEVTLHPLQIATVPTEALGIKVGCLSGEGDAIVDTLDEIFSRAFG